MLGSQFIRIHAVRIQPQIGFPPVVKLGNHRRNLDIFNGHRAVLLRHNVEVCQFPDQVHVVRLGRNEIPQRIEHKALRTVRSGQIFHCLCHMRVGADNHIAAPVNDFLCQCFYAVGNVVGILHAPVTGHHYHVRNFLGCGDLLLDNVLL